MYAAIILFAMGTIITVVLKSFLTDDKNEKDREHKEALDFRKVKQ